MAEVPAAIAETIPVAISIVPTVGAELVQMPPAAEQVSVPPAPTQYASVPPIAAGAGLTVTKVVAMQPEGAT